MTKKLLVLYTACIRACIRRKNEWDLHDDLKKKKEKNVIIKNFKSIYSSLCYTIKYS